MYELCPFANTVKFWVLNSGWEGREGKGGGWRGGCGCGMEQDSAEQDTACFKEEV